MKKVFLGICLLMFTSLVVFADGNAAIIRQLIAQCEQSLDVRISINQTSDYRTIRRQAELMANMTPSTRISLYNNAYYVKEMNDNDNLSSSQKIDKFEQILNAARRNGSRISYHITGDAVDITPSTQQVRNWFEKNGVSVLDETESGVMCWHLQLK